MPAQTFLPVRSFASIEPSQPRTGPNPTAGFRGRTQVPGLKAGPRALPSQVAAVAARESYSHPLVIRSLAAHAARGERLGVLIGHNRFDVYALSRLALEHGLDPRPLLEHIELSRAFTCHQLHRRILTLGAPHIQRWSALYVLGLLDTFYDEDVKPYEARRLLNECLVKLKEIAASGLPVLITVSAPQEPGREHFLEEVARRSDMYRVGAARGWRHWEPREEAPRLDAPRQLALEFG
jgi:hypothetical protein